MERLQVTPKEFFRHQWASPDIAELWAPRVSAIAKAWLELEVTSVEVGLRNAAMQFVAVEEFEGRRETYSKRGLALLPLGKEGLAGNDYSNAAGGGESHFRVLVTQQSKVKGLEYTTIFDAAANLGYPHCCREVFRLLWQEQDRRDLSWAQAQGTDKVALAKEDKSLAVLSYFPECNVLLRYFGVRMVPHLPCSYTCDKSRSLGREFAKLGRDGKWFREIDWAYELLNMPARWSALHGIAEITTPIVKLIAGTDVTAKQYQVELHGDYYPIYGARGKGFPLNTKHGELNPKDNGFNKLTDQDASHYELALFAGQVLRHKRFEDVVDLGCGDGSLLHHIAKRTGCRATGVDSSFRKIAKVQAYGFSGYSKSIRDYHLGSPYLVLIAAERLQEEAIDITELAKARFVLIYSYSKKPPEYNFPGARVKFVLNAPHVKAVIYEILHDRAKVA